MDARFGEVSQHERNILFTGDKGAGMFQTTIQTRQGEVAVRPMDRDYIFAGDLSLPNFFGQTGRCISDGVIDPKQARPNLFFSSVHRALLDQYDAPPILAWGNGQIVGFLNSYPEGLFETHVCLLEEDLAKAVQVRKEGLPNMDSDTLHLACLTVAPEYRRQGIGTAMVRCLQEHCRNTRWRYLTAECRGDGHPDRWRPLLSFWRKLGFTIKQEPSPESAERERRMWESLAEKTGVPLNGHCCRQSFGTYILEYNVQDHVNSVPPTPSQAVH